MTIGMTRTKWNNEAKEEERRNGGGNSPGESFQKLPFSPSPSLPPLPAGVRRGVVSGRGGLRGGVRVRLAEWAAAAAGAARAMSHGAVATLVRLAPLLSPGFVVLSCFYPFPFHLPFSFSGFSIFGGCRNCFSFRFFFFLFLFSFCMFIVSFVSLYFLFSFLSVSFPLHASLLWGFPPRFFPFPLPLLSTRTLSSSPRFPSPSLTNICML